MLRSAVRLSSLRRTLDSQVNKIRKYFHEILMMSHFFVDIFSMKMIEKKPTGWLENVRVCSLLVLVIWSCLLSGEIVQYG